MDAKLAVLNRRTNADKIYYAVMSRLTAAEKMEKDIATSIRDGEDNEITTENAVDRLRSGQDKFRFFDKELFMMESSQPGGRMDTVIKKLEDMANTLRQQRDTALSAKFQDRTRPTIALIHGEMVDYVRRIHQPDLADSQLLMKAFAYMQDVNERLQKLPKGKMEGEN